MGLVDWFSFRAGKLGRSKHRGDAAQESTAARLHRLHLCTIFVRSLAVLLRQYFAYHRMMDTGRTNDLVIAAVAGAIGEPSRARMLYCLMDGRARTSTELAAAAGVGASTASSHLNRLQAQRLVKVVARGRHRYFSLGDVDVANILEALNVFAGCDRQAFAPSTPDPLRAARTCYDHLAGTIAVRLHDRLHDAGWLSPGADASRNGYVLARKGIEGLAELGIDVEASGARRRLAYGCLDWSERRFHVGGAVGAALLGVVLKKKWMTRDLDGRALRVTRLGRRELLSRFDIDADACARR